MKLRKLVAILTLVMLPVIVLWGQPFVRTTIFRSNAEELQGRITNVTQDCNGYIWIGSHNGLHKYDGNNFYKYKIEAGSTSPLTSNRIDRVTENKSGDIWCMSNDCVYLFRPQEESFVDVQSSINHIKKENISITRIFSLSNGFSWLTDKDGNLFRVCNSSPENNIEYAKPWNDKSVRIFAVWNDKNDNEWIFSNLGSYIYNKKQLISKRPFRFYKSIQGKLWLATEQGDIASYSEESGKLQFSPDIPSWNRIIDFRHLNDSVILISSDKGCYTLNCIKREFKLLSTGQLGNIFIDSQQRMWGINDRHQTECITISGERKQYSTPYLLPRNEKIVFVEDVRKTIWMFFRDNASHILYADEKSNALIAPAGIPESNIAMKNLIVDNQNNVWFRLENDLCKVSLFNYPFHFYDNESLTRTRCLFTDPLQRLWVSDYEGFVCIYNADKSIAGYLSPSGEIVDNKIKFGTAFYCSYLDKNGDIWLGSNTNGVYYLQQESSQSYRISHYVHQESDPNSLNCNLIFDIYRDSYHHLWIGTRGGGLNLFDNGKFIHKDNELGKNINISMPLRVRCIKEIKPGILMVGSSEGLYIINNRFSNPNDITVYNNVRQPSRLNSLSENDVMYILPASTGIYLATNSGGVNKIESSNLMSDTLSFKVYSKKDLLASDIVFSIIEDAHQKLWIIGENTLTHLDPLKETSDQFGTGYFPNGFLFTEASPRNGSSEFYIGTSRGFMSFAPSQIVKRSFCPPVVFTDLYIQNIPSNQRLRNDTIRLEADERGISLNFAALDYNQAGNILYKFKLDGVDKQWNINANNSIVYMNLPSGEHTFHLCSTNGDGVWVDNERCIVIQVTPRFTETGWFWFVIALGCCLIASAIFYIYQRFYQLHQSLNLEKRITDMKLRFFTDISHELRTPLTLIDGPVTELLNNGKVGPEQYYYLSLIKNNTQRMLNLVNQILDFRKIQNQKMTLMVEPLNIREEITRITSSFDALATEHGIKFSCIFQKKEKEIDNEEIEYILWADRDKLEKIMFNLLSNAFKYTPDNHSIRLIVNQSDEFTEISIKDEGIGISRENIDKIFTRFETVAQDNLFKPSSGIGLALVKQFVELHEARLTVESKPNEGSNFRILFRNGNRHFRVKNQVEILLPHSKNERMLTQNNHANETENSSDLKTILIVEDNTELRRYIHNILSPAYCVIEAVNGEDGLGMCKEHWPDLIISDIVMPVMNGFEMVQQLRQDSDLYLTPIILLTSKTEIENKIKGADLRVDDYITKPFSTNYLKAKVTALIKQRSDIKNHILQSLTGSNPSNHTINETDHTIITPDDQAFITAVKTYIEEHLSDSELTIDQISQSVNMGRTIFYQKIKALLGIKPVELVQEIRIQKAIQLIATHRYNISEITYMVGYSDPRYFSRNFKKHIGKLPSEYIKEERNSTLF